MYEGSQQGSFTSDGKNKTLKIRSGFDWIRIVNETQHAATNNGYGVEYYWRLGQGTKMTMAYRPAADHTVGTNIVTSAITVVDSSDFATGSRISVTAGTNAVQPVYSTGDTSGLTVGSIVRIDSSAQTNLNGLDFSIDTINANTDFRLANALATAPGIAAGAAGYYKLIAPNIEIYRMFTPSNRNISNITSASSAVVTTLVDHGYAIGQQVSFKVPEEFGMTQLDGLSGNITAVTDSTFTVDIDTSSFTAFKFPSYTLSPFVLASVVPVGDNPAYSGYMTAPGAFKNQGFSGVILTAGTTGPGGNAGDVISWRAGKSEVVDNA